MTLRELLHEMEDATHISITKANNRTTVVVSLDRNSFSFQVADDINTQTLADVTGARMRRALESVK